MIVIIDFNKIFDIEINMKEELLVKIWRDGVTKERFNSITQQVI